MSDQPQRACNRCGGPCGDHWSAPSPLWNYVMRGDDINGPWQYGELICPQCFMLLAEERIGHPLHWRLYAENVDVPLKTVTPSGRVWNPETWLWDDPDGCECLGEAKCVEHFLADLDAPEQNRLLTQVRRVDQKYGPFDEFRYWREAAQNNATDDA